jgi:hypothetical protein
MDTPTEEQEQLSLEAQRQISRLLDHNSELVKDSHSLQSLVSTKNAAIVRLEAENLRLKMTRTDKELSTQVDALRTEVGKKDKLLVEYQKVIENYKGNEIIILRRAAVAEQKVATVQDTMTRIQKSRDASAAEADKNDKARLDAIRDMVAVSDQLRKANERAAALSKELDELKKKQQPKK